MKTYVLLEKREGRAEILYVGDNLATAQDLSLYNIEDPTDAIEEIDLYCQEWEDGKKTNYAWYNKYQRKWSEMKTL